MIRPTPTETVPVFAWGQLRDYFYSVDKDFGQRVNDYVTNSNSFGNDRYASLGKYENVLGEAKFDDDWKRVVNLLGLSVDTHHLHFYVSW
jgi:hypothetical protein